ncbi:MAG: hypothetical protein R3B99_12745 [Polyangiales bacterium]
MKRTQWLIVLAALAIGVGCGDDDVMTPDSGMGDAGRDAGRDAGMTDGGSDAGMDATVDVDAGTDGGVDDDGGMDDGGMDDAGTDGGTDAGMMMVGGGAATSAEITTVLAAADDAVTLMINDAVVTYVKPAIDDMEDGAGFFLQAEQTGPALYVGVDPSTLTPAPEVGDVVTLRVTNLATSGGGLRYATSVDMLTVDSSDHSVDFLVQEVSAVDLVTNLDQYPAELISLVGTIETEFAGAGTGFSAAQITTAGVATTTSSLRFRIPQSVLSTLTIGTGCDIDLGPTPLWRFTTTAQPSAWAAADVTVDCPAPGAGEPRGVGGRLPVRGFRRRPRVRGAPQPEHRGLRPRWLHPERQQRPGGRRRADAPGGLDDRAGWLLRHCRLRVRDHRRRGASLGARVRRQRFGHAHLRWHDRRHRRLDDDELRLADDVSMQLSPTQLDATANDTLTNWCPTLASETYGTMGRRGTPGAANVSCVVPAVVRINEVNAHIDGGCDLVELRVVSGGSMGGFRFQERGSSIYTFAEGFTVAANDIVVIHMDSGTPTARAALRVRWTRRRRSPKCRLRRCRPTTTPRTTSTRRTRA